MQIVSSTDGKYVGITVDELPSVGDVVTFGDFSFDVVLVFHLENGNYCVGNPNYQLEMQV